MNQTPPKGVERRQFLVIGGSTLLLTACQVLPAPPKPSTTAPSPRPAPEPEPEGPPPPPAEPPPAPGPGSYTIDDLLSTMPFYIAHRGSGDEWVEHSFDAYARSIAAGAKAIEVSVRATSDGVLVCHHDETTERMTDTDLAIRKTSYATLSALRNDAREWLGPAAPLQPIPLLSTVLDTFAGTHVIFIEDKQGTNTQALLDVMDSYPDSTAHFVWKQWAGAPTAAAAAARGYRTWGYFNKDVVDQAAKLAPQFDYLGVEHTATDAQVSRLVAFGKPVIVWRVHYRALRDRMLALGVAGMMSSNYPYVTGTAATARSDSFATGLRAQGDLPWTTDQGWGIQPRIAAAAATISVADEGVQSYLMGSMCPIAPGPYRITLELRWPKTLPGPREHVGFAFGAPDDKAYLVRRESPGSGYHVVIRADGSLELFRKSPSSVYGLLIARVRTKAPRPGEWMRLRVDVTPARIRMLRLDGAGWSTTVNDGTYRGGYLWLCKNYGIGPPVEFRHVTVA